MFIAGALCRCGPPEEPRGMSLRIAPLRADGKAAALSCGFSFPLVASFPWEAVHALRFGLPRYPARRGAVVKSGKQRWGAHRTAEGASESGQGSPKVGGWVGRRMVEGALSNRGPGAVCAHSLVCPPTPASSSLCQGHC